MLMRTPPTTRGYKSTQEASPVGPIIPARKGSIPRDQTNLDGSCGRLPRAHPQASETHARPTVLFRFVLSLAAGRWCRRRTDKESSKRTEQQGRPPKHSAGQCRRIPEVQECRASRPRDRRCSVDVQRKREEEYPGWVLRHRLVLSESFLRSAAGA